MLDSIPFKISLLIFYLSDSPRGDGCWFSFPRINSGQTQAI